MASNSPTIHQNALTFWRQKGESLFRRSQGYEAKFSSEAIKKDLNRRLDQYRVSNEHDPFSNSITLLSLDIAQRVDQKRLTPDSIDCLIQRLSLSAITFRAERMRRYLGEVDIDKNTVQIRRLLEKVCGPKNNPIPFERFRTIVETKIFGIVFTAHPTFSLDAPLLKNLATLASSNPDDHATRNQALSVFSQTALQPKQAISLDDEYALAHQAICHTQIGLRRLNDIIFSVAEEYYPDLAHSLSPRLISVASWVGYDIDGRSDITWIDTFHKRLQAQISQLQHYRQAVQEIININKKPSKNKILRDILDDLYNSLAALILTMEEEIKVFAPGPDDAPAIEAIAQQMHADYDKRLISSHDLIEKINQAIKQCNENSIGSRRIHGLCILRAEIANYGLAAAHTHVRINASQLHNAISPYIAMEGDPDDPARRQTYLRRLNKILDEVEPVSINFGSLLGEPMSAKRLFMIVAQMLKYTDSTTAVRFLIAECETALTPLSALYFARMFDIEDHIDISPLFETERALERGHNIIDVLLSNPLYRRYIEKRKRLAVQMGFSDSGRYIGQPAAGLAMENLHLNLGRVLAKHQLKDVEVVVFNTHGESIGRGGHPKNMQRRFDYLSSPYVRQFYAQHNLTLKNEVSFQGGDGYSWFMNEACAFAVIARIIDHHLDVNDGAKKSSEGTQGDPFYRQAEFAAELTTTITQFNRTLMDDPDYAVLLRLFSPRIMPSTGSRPVTRQTEDAIRSFHPSQMRAIPQNTLLQQIGFLANSLGGVGSAFNLNREKFRRLYQRSERFRCIFSLCEYAFAFSDFDILKSYFDLVNPGHWLASAERANHHRQALKQVASVLRERDLYGHVSRAGQKLQGEYIDLREWLLGQSKQGRLAIGGGRIIDKNMRDDLLLLHALRIALIRSVYILSMRVPHFSFQKGRGYNDIILDILRLDIDIALNFLREIFPRRATHGGDFGEKATYRSQATAGYSHYHDTVFDPLARLHQAIQRISSSIAHFIGAVG